MPLKSPLAMKRPKIIKKNNRENKENTINTVDNNSDHNKNNTAVQNNNDNDNNDNNNKNNNNNNNPIKKSNSLSGGKKLKCRFSAMSLEIFCLSGEKKVGVSFFFLFVCLFVCLFVYRSEERRVGKEC